MQRWTIRLMAVMILASVLPGCGLRPRTSSLTFTAASAPGGTSVDVIIDIVGTPGSKPLIRKYPIDLIVSTPYTHIVFAEPRSIAHSSIRVVATEPDQIVGCSILVNAKVVMEGAGTYGKPALCLGPPL